MNRFAHPVGGWAEPTGPGRLRAVVWSACSTLLDWLLLAAPAASAVAVVPIMALCWLLGGAAAAVAAVWRRTGAWGWCLAGGVCSAVAGLVVLAHPLFSTVVAVETLFVLIGLSALVTGVATLAPGRSPATTFAGAVLRGVGLLMLVLPVRVVALASPVRWIGLPGVFGGLLSRIAVVPGRHAAADG